MQVLKFGGSSVANAANIIRVTSIAAEAAKRDKTILVSSAIAGCTNKLIEIATMASVKDQKYKEEILSLHVSHSDIIEEIIPLEFRDGLIEQCNALLLQLNNVLEGITLVGELTSSSLDTVMSFGELLSTTIISAKLNSEGVNNVWTDSRKLIKTYRRNSANHVSKKETYNNIIEYLSANGTRLYIVPGFIASDATGKTTTLGRGGSDYTASLFAVASGARVLEIWTDVNGMMTADPRIVPRAKTIEHISYTEALELSHFGAKVVYSPTIQPVVKHSIPIVVKNTFDPNGPSTIIESNPPEAIGKIRGISSSNKIALLSLEGSGMVGIPGYSARFFTALAKSKIDILLITQASSIHTMCVAIEEPFVTKAGKAVDSEFAYEITLGKVNPVIVEKGFSIISLVGNDMKNQSGTSGKIFDALGNAGINIRAIAQGSSERNISAILMEEDSAAAVKVVHDRFFVKARNKKIHLFIAGYGNVGKSLVSLIEEQKSIIAIERGLDISICGLSTSSLQIFSKEGIGHSKAENIYKSGKSSNINNFIRDIVALSPCNPVFVDCTSSGNVASLYTELLSNGISVVTCNKIAPSAPLHSWENLKNISLDKGVSLLYETTAGAALPIIETIKRLKESGEEITGAQAILSGTLNYLYSNYDGSKPFASLIKEAQDAGYTEPNPATDLSGTDVLRKCTIISRECGFNVEQKDIEAVAAAPAEIFEGDKDNFYSLAHTAEPFFAAKLEQASQKGERLRYIASITPNKQSIGIASLSPDNPLYNVCGTNNSITITTRNYPSGITITGAGAGARVTAGGVLNDIIKAAL
ncbi:MAG: bifunctional aspartate kinase/homoserine dehydrogenase I [Bacteroidales bacterium]|nr:bifunctional aspartate kinase/homoserine dehydrogenase I [Bacteroidales bacterium]